MRMDVITRWIAEHKDELNGERKEWEKLGAETIIDLSKVSGVRSHQFDWKKEDGSATKSVKFFYERGTPIMGQLDSFPLLVPYKVHYAIVSMVKENPGKIQKFKVKKSGSGLETKYEVTPLL